MILKIHRSTIYTPVWKWLPRGRKCGVLHLFLPRCAWSLFTQSLTTSVGYQWTALLSILRADPEANLWTILKRRCQHTCVCICTPQIGLGKTMHSSEVLLCYHWYLKPPERGTVKHILSIYYIFWMLPVRNSTFLFLLAGLLHPA